MSQGNTTLRREKSHLRVENSALQSLANQSDAEKEKLRRSRDEHRSRLSQLTLDHAAFESLHQQLTLDHSELQKEFGNLRQRQEELKERQNKMSAGKEDLLQLKEALEVGLSELKMDSDSLATLRGKCSKLQDDFRNKISANESCSLIVKP